MKILICASSRDLHETYTSQAIELGKGLGVGGHHVIYGGGNQGLMALVAGAAGDAGSKIEGIIPDAFNKASPDVPHPQVTTHLVKNLFARKEQMLFDADVAIVLPGGIGTLDELWEVAAANDIQGYIDDSELLKPVMVLNTNNFFEGTKIQMQKCIDEGCVSVGKTRMFYFYDTAEEILAALAKFAETGLPRLSSLTAK